MTAFFTEPLGDEFRKAIEEAISEINATEGEKKNKSQKKPRRRKRLGEKASHRRSASRATKPK